MVGGECGYEYIKNVMICDNSINMFDYITLCMAIIMVDDVDVLCIEIALYQIELGI